MRIGVIGDTHIPQAMPTLPTARLKEVFKGVDMILHVGDVCNLATLQELQNNFAITHAVAGERDLPEARKYLEQRKVVKFGKRKIGMIHGHRPGDAGLMARLRRLFKRDDPEALYQYVLSQFEDVDAIVFGHTHTPYVKSHGGVLLMNPGSAGPVAGAMPSIGLLDVTERAITGRILHL